VAAAAAPVFGLEAPGEADAAAGSMPPRTREARPRRQAATLAA
jgi:hypothetical protein